VGLIEREEKMLKTIVSVFALSLLLAGCSNDETTKEKTEEDVKKEQVGKVSEKKTREQYLAEFEGTPTYQESIEGKEGGFLEAVDFDGDEIPEMVHGVNEDATHSKVSIYKLEDEQWNQTTAFDYESGTHISLVPIGKLKYDNGSLKEALAFGRTEAQANSTSQGFSILNYNEHTQMVEELLNIPLQSSEIYSESLKENKITVYDQKGYTVNYIFKNGEVVDSNGKRLGLIIDEALAKITGTTINDYYLSLKDSYSTAKDKIKEPFKTEEYYEGALCSFYDTFFICDYHKDNGGMHAFYITPKKEVTVEEIAGAFNKELEIKEWENMMEGGYSYTAEVKTESGLYSLQFDGQSTDSILEFISYVPNE